MKIKNIHITNFKYCDNDLIVVFEGQLNNGTEFLKEIADLIKKYEVK